MIIGSTLAAKMYCIKSNNGTQVDADVLTLSPLKNDEYSLVPLHPFYN